MNSAPRESSPPCSLELGIVCPLGQAHTFEIWDDLTACHFACDGVTLFTVVVRPKIDA